MKRLSDFNREVWNEYDSINAPVEKTLVRQGYIIYQKQSSGDYGETEVSIGGTLLRINWQACNANICVDSITDKVLDFIKKEIVDVEDTDILNSEYFWINGSELLDWLLCNHYGRFQYLEGMLNKYNNN